MKLNFDKIVKTAETSSKECRTLDELCKKLNGLGDGDYPLALVNKAIEENGWEELGDDWDICTDGKEILTMTESGEYKVVERL